MKEQTQGLVISLLIHGTIFAFIWWVSFSVVKVSLPIELNFGLVQQESSSGADQSKHVNRASSPLQKQIVVREQTAERKHIVEQPKIDQSVQPSNTEAAVPVQEPKQMAAVESSPVGSAGVTGQTSTSGAAGEAVKGGGNASSSSGAGTSDNVTFGSVLGPSFLHQELPVYPLVARRMNMEGKVLLRLTIDETGKLLNVEVIERAGFGMTESAIDAVKKSTYRPARIKGRAVVSRALLPISFELTQ